MRRQSLCEMNWFLSADCGKGTAFHHHSDLFHDSNKGLSVTTMILSLSLIIIPGLRLKNGKNDLDKMHVSISASLFLLLLSRLVTVSNSLLSDMAGWLRI